MNKQTAFIKTLPCCICGDPTGADAAHVKSRQDGRLDGHTMGRRKTADGIDLMVPLCAPHHRQQHGMKESEFWEWHGIDAARLAGELHRNTGDTEKAMGLLGKAAKERMMG